MRPRRALRPLPDRGAARRQPAHRAAGVAVRARAGRAVPDARRGPRHRARAAERSRRGSSADLARDRPRLGRPGRAPVRAPASCYADALAGWTPRGCCTRAGARARRSARRPRRRTAPLPEGAYPGTCRELTAAQRAEREARRPAAGAAGARRRRAGGVRRPPARRVDRRRRRLRRAPQRRRLRLQPRRRGRRRRPGRRRGRARRRPARLDAAPALARRAARAAGAASTPTSRSCSGPTARGWPSATAP